MTAVLQSRAGETYIGTFAARCAVGLPLEDGEGSGTDLAFFAMVLLDHLNEGVIGETIFADGGKIGGFPTGTIEILFDLRGHFDGRVLCRDGSRVFIDIL